MLTMGSPLSRMHHVHRLVGRLGGEMDLPHDGEAVARVTRLMLRVAAGGRLEERQLQIDAVERNPVAQHLQRPALGHQRRHLRRQRLAAPRRGTASPASPTPSAAWTGRTQPTPPRRASLPDQTSRPDARCKADLPPTMRRCRFRTCSRSIDRGALA